MIKFSNVNLAYNGRVILDNFSFEVKAGEKVVILGKSALGKSSLLLLILGFVVPDRGEIFFDGKRINEKTVWNVRRQVAYVDQDVSIGVGKVSEWIDFVSGLKANASLDFGNKKIRELLGYFELGSDVFHKDVGELSGGERQRLGIVVSVLLGRSVFLLDEVTSALDKHLKELVARFFLEKDDWTVVVVSHDPVWLDSPSVRVFDLEAERWKR